MRWGKKISLTAIFQAHLDSDSCFFLHPPSFSHGLWLGFHASPLEMNGDCPMEVPNKLGLYLLWPPFVNLAKIFIICTTNYASRSLTIRLHSCRVNNQHPFKHAILNHTPYIKGFFNVAERFFFKILFYFVSLSYVFVHISLHRLLLWEWLFL